MRITPSDIHAVYDIYVFLFSYSICQKDCISKAYGLHQVWLENGLGLTALSCSFFSHQGPGVHKEDGMAKQVIYLGSIWA